jgi:hypothetical protein
MLDDAHFNAAVGAEEMEPARGIAARLLLQLRGRAARRRRLIADP